MSFNWTELIPGVGKNVHVATLGIATVGSILVGTMARHAVRNKEEAVVPAGHISIKGVFELLTEMISNLSEMVIGHNGKKYIPFFSSIFFFILFNNLLGMLPGMTPATENINTSFGFGVFIFFFYNFLGLKENGWGYLKHFIGPVWWLFFLMIPLEIISHVVRPFTLGLRLANVLMGDHAVLSMFLDLVPFGIPIIFYLMGLLVCVVQAFVFTLLSMVYVAFAIAHEH